MFVDETTIEQEYNKGYKMGYEWLTKGWNFLHPNGTYTYPNGRILRGYIPGGPIYFNRSSTWDYNKSHSESRLGSKLHKAWIDGWIDGINKYVLDNNLTYPQLKKGI